MKNVHHRVVFIASCFLLFLCSSNNQIKKQPSIELRSWLSALDSVTSKNPSDFLKKLCSNGLKVCDIDSLVIQKRKQYFFDKNVVLGIYFVCDTCSPCTDYGRYVYPIRTISVYNVDSAGYYDSSRAYMSRACVFLHELAHAQLMPIGLSVEAQHVLIKTEVEFALVELFFPWIQDSLSVLYENKKIFSKKITQFKKRHFKETGKRFQNTSSCYIDEWRERKRTTKQNAP
ncbi:hypothetical protein IT403_03385 [Candidatus Nomurabacteria bacterium]|nr:hypothetical protein [Candidatus Nomurabacteria bacterium]